MAGKPKVKLDRGQRRTCWRQNTEEDASVTSDIRNALDGEEHEMLRSRPLHGRQPLERESAPGEMRFPDEHTRLSDKTVN